VSGTAPDYNKIAGVIGLAVRARQTVIGEEACVNAIRGRKAAVALLDEGASPNARKRFLDACAHHEVPLVFLPESLLGRAAGKPGRMALVMIKGGLADQVLLQAGSGQTEAPSK